MLIELRREKEKIIRRLAQDEQARRRVRLGYFLNTTAGRPGPTWPAGRAGWHGQDRGRRDKQGRQSEKQRQVVMEGEQGAARQM